MTEDYKVQVSITVPPRKQGVFESGDMLNVRANSGTELDAILNGLRQSGDPAISQFFEHLESGTAVAAVQNAFQGATEIPTPVVPAPAAAQAGSLGTCPQCGHGQLVNKLRKDKSGSFVGCNRFPACDFIKRD